VCGLFDKTRAYKLKIHGFQLLKENRQDKPKVSAFRLTIQDDHQAFRSLGSVDIDWFLGIPCSRASDLCTIFDRHFVATVFAKSGSRDFACPFFPDEDIATHLLRSRV